MGYKILYNPEMKEKFPEAKRNMFTQKFIKVLAVAAITVLIFSVLGRENVVDYFIPGDPDITQAAFETMVNELKNGAAVKNAVAVFCREIITGAEIINA